MASEQKNLFYKIVTRAHLCAIGFTAAMILYGTPAHADELYALAWTGTEYTRSGSGQVVAKPFTQKRFINEVAQNHGVPASDLVLVYRPLKRDISMVRKSDGSFVASIIQMEYVFTDVSNSPGTATVRHTFLFDEYHDSAIGSAFGREKLTWGPNGGLASYTFSGKFNYAYTESQSVFTGSFTTGRKIKDHSGN
jgi:hypothetical protein